MSGESSLDTRSLIPHIVGGFDHRGPRANRDASPTAGDLRLRSPMAEYHILIIGPKMRVWIQLLALTQ